MALALVAAPSPRLGRAARSEVVDDDAVTVEPPAGRDFDAFYNEHYARLVRLAVLLTRSADCADDLVQDVFIRAYPRWETLEDPGPYLRRSVVNAASSWWRRRRLERERAVAAPDSTTEHPDELFDVLRALPPRQRAAVVLRYYEGLSDRQIADALGCRPGTVGSLIHRALARLREVVVPDGEGDAATTAVPGDGALVDGKGAAPSVPGGSAPEKEGGRVP